MPLKLSNRSGNVRKHNDLNIYYEQAKQIYKSKQFWFALWVTLVSSYVQKFMVHGLPGADHAAPHELQPVPIPDLRPASKQEEDKMSETAKTQVQGDRGTMPVDFAFWVLWQ